MTVLRDYAKRLAQPPLGDLDETTLAPRYDEVVAPDGSLRSAWKPMAETAVRITADDLRRVGGDISRSLVDDGVTYTRPGEAPSPWRLDPVPLVLESAAWAELEKGLAQRAELLNALLVDLYGDQRLLANGVLPAPVVFAHAGFVRAVGRGTVRDPRPLVISSTDLGRDADGVWRVLADRAEAPSGLGYAMENRKVIARALPDLYRDAGIHRMEPYLAALRSALIQSAQGDLVDPRVVVLSPGSGSETAYDQAFLASALGFPLVQGSDLLVRDGWVQMRVPDARRFERVDVILRRVDASWTDSLQLRGDSRLGVAGLVEAVRRGRVRVVNGLGSGVLENPGLLPFMPALCERLLGEEIRLPCLPTWWCGDPDSLESVLERFGRGEEMLVRTIDGPSAGRVGLTASQAHRLIRAEPHRYVVQQRFSLSQAPTWREEVGRGGDADGTGGGAVVPRPLTLRTFTVRYGSAYRPLIGGLASVVDDGRSVASKDVWVLKGDSDPDQGLIDVLPMTSVRSSTVTVPRILEDMFWVGRYAERAEDMLRMVLAAHTLSEEFRTSPRSTGGASLAVMVQATRRLAGQMHPADLDAEFRSLLLERTRVGSVAHALSALRDSLAGVRDQLSLDTWRVFGVTDRAAYTLATSDRSQQVAESAGGMLTGILALQGVTGSMIRDPAWHTIGIGRCIERALQVAHLLAATTTVRRGLDVDRDVLNSVLVTTESSVTHRRRYRGTVRPGGVLELLVMDRENPRSVAFALAELAEHLRGLPTSTGSTRPERLVADLIDELSETDVATLVAIGGEGRPNLRAFLIDLIGQLQRLANAVAQVHFESGPAPRAFAALHLVDSIERLEP